MNRRDLMTAALAAPLAAVPAVAVAETETPVMALFREWKAIFDRIEADGGPMSQDAFNALCDERIALEDRIAVTPVETLSDFAAKFIALTNDCDPGYLEEQFRPEFWAEARALVGQAA